MEIFKFLRKKDTTKVFIEAVSKHNYLDVIKYGMELLGKNPSAPIVNEIADAYVKLNRKDEAVKLLKRFGEEKFDDGYYKIAGSCFLKALNISPLDLPTAVDLSKAYENQGLYYEVFSVLKDIFERIHQRWRPQSKGLQREGRTLHSMSTLPIWQLINRRPLKITPLQLTCT